MDRRQRANEVSQEIEQKMIAEIFMVPMNSYVDGIANVVVNHQAHS